MTVKYIDIKEFREKGYLQELNRRFLHPLGLAVEIIIEEDGTERLGNVWDCREDEEGVYYDLENSQTARIEAFKTKKEFIDKELDERFLVRKKLLGYFIEPIPEIEVD